MIYNLWYRYSGDSDFTHYDNYESEQEAMHMATWLMASDKVMETRITL